MIPNLHFRSHQRSPNVRCSENNVESAIASRGPNYNFIVAPASLRVLAGAVQEPLSSMQTALPTPDPSGFEKQSSAQILPDDAQLSSSTHLSPAELVFGIVELCETILLHALPADILRCSRVSRTLHSTILHSRAIRQLLYLEPVPSDTTQPRSLNPLTPAFFQRKDGYQSTTLAARIDVAAVWAGVQHRLPPAASYKSSHTRDAAKTDAAEVKEKGWTPSWHSMLIAQPPPVTLVMQTDTDLTMYPRRYYPAGMTFGDLERAVVAGHDLRKGIKTHPERLAALTEINNPVFIYWR